MNDVVNRLLEAVWGIWRFRWASLALAWLVAVGGWVAVYQIEHKYEGKARIYVDTNSVLEPLMSGIAVQNDVKQRVALLTRTMLNRENLGRLIDTTSLQELLSEKQDRESLLRALESELALFDSSGNQSLYSITYANTDPVLAREVVAATVDLFIDTVLGEERADSASAQQFLDQRIADYEVQLEDAEKRLSDFKRANAGVTPTESGGYYARLQAAQQQLRTTSLELREAQNRSAEISRQIASEEQAILSGNGGATDADVVRIEGLQEQLDDLLLRFTDRHPRIALLRDTIADLEAKRARAPVARRDRQADLQASVVYQRLRALQAEAEARVVELQVRDQEYRRQARDLSETVDSIPKVEAELKQLDRDYETIKDQYETLLQRRESARLTAQVEQSTDEVKFQVVDPPFVPSRPSVPNKELLNLLVMALAVGAGIALGFLLSLLKPVFYNPRSLAEFARRPLLGSVSLTQSLAATVRQRFMLGMFGLSTAALMASFLVVMYVQMSSTGAGPNPGGADASVVQPGAAGEQLADNAERGQR